MSLIRRSFDYPAWSNLFNEFFDRDWLDWTNQNFSNTNTTLPSVNIKEDGDGFHVEMAAPGMDKNDFKIELNDGFLTISSEKKVENETKEGQKFTKREFSYQSFSRSFTLPDIVDGDKISAKYENGILSVGIPKKEEAKSRPAKTIEIK
ncbi:MAG: Hsp20/alpha crystallin family protein [Bacteroidales bacterium]